MAKNFQKKSVIYRVCSGGARILRRVRKKVLLAVLLVGIGAQSVMAKAATSTEFNVSDEFKTAVTQIYNVAIGFIIIAAVLMIIVGGYTLVFSAGKPDLVTKGKKQITGAIIGLVIAILSAVFLNFLNPRIFQ